MVSTASRSIRRTAPPSPLLPHQRTDSGITIRLPGGVSQTIAADEIASRENMEQSLMPPGLVAALSKQEFADLVAYLQSLKK